MGSMPRVSRSIPSPAAAARRGTTTDRSKASNWLAERQGGELYSSCPPGSNVNVPPTGKLKQGVPLDVQLSRQPCLRPKRRRNGRVDLTPSASMGQRRPVSDSLE